MRKQKLFIVKKYIMATSAQDALKKEKKVPADDCWIDEDWKKANTTQLTPAIGFTRNNENEDA